MSIDSDATGHKDTQLEAAELQLILIAARNLLEEIKSSMDEHTWLLITPGLERAIKTLYNYTKD